MKLISSVPHDVSVIQMVPQYRWHK